MTLFHLAQLNIGRFRAPLDDPIMEGFRTQLDPINALADQSPGFVWRLQTEDGRGCFSVTAFFRNGLDFRRLCLRVAGGPSVFAG